MYQLRPVSETEYEDGKERERELRGMVCLMYIPGLVLMVPMTVV